MNDLAYACRLGLSKMQRPTPCLGYYWGWVGQENLGDTALQAAIYELFKKKILFLDSPKGVLLRALEKLGAGRFDVSLLGGGTFIFENDEELMKISRKDVRRRVVFGSGAADPTFLSQMGKSPDLAKWVSALNRVDYLGVRGPLSQATLIRSGVQSAKVIGDPALFFTRPLQPKRSRAKRLGINFGTTRNILWGQNEQDFLEEFGRLIRRMHEDGWQMEVLPVWAEDLPVIRRLLNKWGLEKAVPVFGNHRSVQAFMDRVATFDVFLGLKLHAVILSYCANTPAVMVEYRPKCRDFMASIDMEEFCIRTDQFSAEGAALQVQKLYDKADEYRDNAHRLCAGYRQKLLAAADEVLARLQTP